MASPSHLWLHRFAVFTACVALLPIVVGALVTTLGAGMAFPDWPTSDGQGMFAYPWLRSTGDKFLEHGHRLAGIVIGLASIALVGMTFAIDLRGWVRAMSVGALLGIIAQGILGGFRVLMDEQGLAFVHGSFAALVFAFLCSLATVTSAGWRESKPGARVTSRQLWIAMTACGLVFVQYVLGGLLRHRGMALTEHLMFAGIATLAIAALAVTSLRSGAAWLRGPAGLLFPLVVAQLALGVATWITKLGPGAGAWVATLGFEDFVATAGSPLQVTLRTGHVLVGMLLFATCVVLAVRTARVVRLSTEAVTVPNALPTGGLA
jgi:cytochrome c oxidase assembly protein subunit 15